MPHVQPCLNLAELHMWCHHTSPRTYLDSTEDTELEHFILVLKSMIKPVTEEQMLQY